MGLNLMADQFTKEDLQLILEALGYRRQAVADYRDYPSYEFKQDQIRKVETVIKKVRAILNPTPS